MKSQKNTRSLLRNPVTWLITGIVLLLTFVALEMTQVIDLIKTPTDTTHGPTVKQQEQDAEANAAKKKDVIENEPKTDVPGNTPTPTPSSSVSLSAKQEANGTVTVFTELHGYNTGTCELVVTNGTKSSTQTAELFYQPEFSSCAGFSVPIDPLGKGAWTIKLSVTSAGKTQDKSISFEVR